MPYPLTNFEEVLAEKLGIKTTQAPSGKCQSFEGSQESFHAAVSDVCHRNDIRADVSVLQPLASEIGCNVRDLRSYLEICISTSQ